jgi:hypothetical protein
MIHCRRNTAASAIFRITPQKIHAFFLLNGSALYGAGIHWQQDRVPALNVIVWPETIRFPKDSSLTTVFDRHSGDAIRCLYMMNIRQRVFIVIWVDYLI